MVRTSHFGFVAVNADGTVAQFGGDVSWAFPQTTSDLLVGVRDVQPSDGGFLALRGDGTVVRVTRTGATIAPVTNAAVFISPHTPYSWSSGTPDPSPSDGGTAPPPVASAPTATSGAPAPAVRTLSVRARLAGRRAIVASVAVDGPGRVSVVGKAGSATACRASKPAKKAGTVTLRCRLSQAARKAKATSIVLTATFAPKAGAPLTGTTTVALARR